MVYQLDLKHSKIGSYYAIVTSLILLPNKPQTTPPKPYKGISVYSY